MKRIICRTIAVVGVAIALVACAGRKQYERPNAYSDKLFRTETVDTANTSAGAIQWRELFTDSQLQGLISRALDRNLDVKVALENVRASHAYLKQSRMAFAPTLSASASYTRSTQSINATGGMGERTYNNLFDLSDTASWELDVWGKLNAQNRAQYASFLASAEAYKAAQSEVVATLATAYYQLLMYDAQREILQHTIDLRQKSLETTKELKKAGSTTEVATQQTEALVLNAQSQLISIENSVWALENSICVLLGEEPHPIERGKLAEQKFPAQLHTGYAMTTLYNRPDVRRAELQLINAFELTNVARAGFYPSLTLTARGGVSSTELDTWFSAKSLFANFVAGLAQPILNARQVRTKYEVQRAAQEQALLTFKKALLTAGKEVSDALHNFAAQDEFIRLKTQEMDAYNKATDYSKQLFNSGMVNYLEVITAEVNRLNAELAVANAQFTKLRQGVVLYKALGGASQVNIDPATLSRGRKDNKK